MFDYHMHTRVSFDAHETGEAMAKAALAAGLKEICFTDHLDYDPLGKMGILAFDQAAYNAEYDTLELPGLKIRRGMEFGMTADNVAQFKKDLQRRPFDFVLGSIHFVDDVDVYFPEYWEGKTVFQAERRYLEATLDCVRIHEDFDVLAHLTYIAKAQSNPVHRPGPFGEHREIIDEILRTVAAKGKGLEMNMAGLKYGLPFAHPHTDILKRYRELGGEIITVGSDGHKPEHVAYDFRRVNDILIGCGFKYYTEFQQRKPYFRRIR